jgi:flagellar M-ring protein FliF
LDNGTSAAERGAEGGTTLSLGGARSAAGPDAGGAPTAAANPFVQRWRALTSAQRWMAGGAALLAVLALAVALLGATPREGDRVLFSNVSERDGAAIIAALQQMGVRYRFTEGGGAILVPAKQVHEVRMRLAGQGLPRASTVGFELLENQRLGTSQFVEQVNYQRGLEGELARTIKSMAQLVDARVHLAIPKVSAFARETQRPTASVVLSLHPGRFLAEPQVTAITHLVSSAVPQLAAQAVTVMDAEGNLLAPNPARDSALGLDAQQLRYLAEVEGSIARRITAILEPIVGPGNVRAQVSVDMDFAQVERTEESYRPNTLPGSAAVRSEQRLRATEPVPRPAGGVPGTLTNVPPQPAEVPIEDVPPTQQEADDASDDPAGQMTRRSEATINYEVDRTVQTVRNGRGALQRVSAAVVVNYRPQSRPDADGFEEVAFTGDELQQINALVRDAMGFNAQRGDSLSVANIAFRPPPAEAAPPLWQDAALRDLVVRSLLVVLGLAALAFLFFAVVKPILFPPPPAPPPPPPEPPPVRLEDELDERLKAELAALSPQARARRKMEIDLERERRRAEEAERRQRAEDERQWREEQLRRDEEERQREYDELLADMRGAVTRNPLQVAAVLRQWMQEGQANA